MTHPLTNDQVSVFVFGGKAIFTLRNNATGNRFTYKLTRKKEIKEGERDVVFVKVLSRPNNTSDYTFLGTIFDRSEYKHSPKSPFGADCQSSKVIGWFVKNMSRLPEQIEVWHEGRCGICGKRLTDPESISLGFGPKCRGGI